MTSDGVTDADWERVHELALKVVNSSLADDLSTAARAQESLIVLLNELDEKYGPKPSLLATRADYVESASEKKRLLHIAYSEADRIRDHRNREMTAHSLAQFYIDEVGDLDSGAKWLGIWRIELGVEPGEFDRTELTRLEGLLLGTGRA